MSNDTQTDSVIDDAVSAIAGLKERTVRGAAVAAACMVAEKTVGLITLAVMARLLTPADYGLLGMVIAFTAFISVFSELGLSAATVQKARLTHEQVSTLFWVNASFGALLALVTAGISPLIAWFYKEPELAWLTAALGAGFAIGGLGVQQTALLARRMQFVRLASASLTALILSSLVGILTAWYGWGPWALIAMTISMRATTVAGVWILSGWVPGPLMLRRSGTRPMLRFGRDFAVFNVLYYFSQNLDKALLGRVWGADAVGYYTRGYHLMVLPITTVTKPLSRVIVPAFSRLQHDHARLRRAFSQAMGLIALVTFPMMVGAGILAPEVVRIVYGPQWGPIVPIFQILCVTGLFQGVYGSLGWLFVPTGRTDRLLRWGMFTMPIICIGYVLGLRWGAFGVAAGYTAAMCLIIYPCLRYSYNTINLRVATVMKEIAGPFWAALAMGVVVWPVRSALARGTNHFQVFFICVAIGAVVYAAIIALTSGRHFLQIGKHLLNWEGAGDVGNATRHD